MTTTGPGVVAPPRSTGRVLPASVRWWQATEMGLRVYRRSWRGTLFSGFLMPVLYLGSLGYGLGTLVKDGGTGVPYAEFVAPGVLAAQALHTAVSESTYPVLGAVKWQRQYHAMLASPLTVNDIVVGHTAYVVLRGLLATASFAAVGALLGAFTSWWVVLAVVVAVLCCAAHTLPVMAFAVGREGDQAFPMLFRFGVIPMFLFAGTFFPVEQLPAGLHQFAWVTPLWHTTELCRDLCLGTVEALPAAGHLAYLFLWIVVGAWFAVREYTKRLVD